MTIEIVLPPLPSDLKPTDPPRIWKVEFTYIKQYGDCDQCGKQHVLTFSGGEVLPFDYCAQCLLDNGYIYEL